ncbi:MAG: DUF1127 domain-containing protein [Alphaproteobacteria bacterium]|nr:DUF1127 domain-containing protein [Alphaproteobacteria bacterium]MBV9017375.1 DUF1127 domain-containing protein [Alphaproteobacteria bacterium]MBV9151251.1 DUF1127 domain-containing protein [Alphaproteobacteria bacterium]MBV9584664.1 DUF1127 domain-containing protein [Alphaproteobacteria bacterium]
MKTVSLDTAWPRVGLQRTRRARRRALRDRVRPVVGQAAALLREWRRRARSRAELARLDDRMLRDIGVTPGEAWQEINKPFWRK